MKIENFEIRDYGPLPDLGIINLDGFNLFYGKNESGKTLVIDALIKLLIGTPVFVKEKLNRINEKPIGHVNIIDLSSNKQTLKGKDLLPDILGLTPREFYNIFVIRDSDLSIQDQKDFYNKITDHLLGLRINDIERIDQELLDIGNITPSGMFRDTSPEKLKSRIKNARECIKTINHLIDRVNAENLDELEQDKVKISRNIDILKKDIEDHEKARNREKYELGIDAFNNLKKAKTQFEKLNLFNDSDRQKWRDNLKNIEMYNTERTNLEKKLNEYKKEFQQITLKIEEKKSDLRIPEKAKARLDEIIKPEIRKYKAETGELEEAGIINKFFRKLWLVSLILFSTYFLVGFPSNSLFLIFMGVFFAILTVGILVFFKYPYIKKKGFIDGFVERINLELKEFGLDGPNYKEVSNKILNFETEYEQKKEKLNELKNLKQQYENNILRLSNDEIPNQKGKIKEGEKVIDLLKRTSMVESLGEYEEKLEIKWEIERRIEKEKSRLDIISTEGNNENDKVMMWESELAKLEKYKDKAKEISYDDDHYVSLKNNKDTLEQEREEINLKLTDLKNDLLEIERRVNDILNDYEEHICCSTTSDLENIKLELTSFISKNKKKKETILEIRNILDEIKYKEKEKISKLLSKESSILKYFKEITNGLYEELTFKIDPFEIKVRRKDDQILSLNQLSGGTFDQLYLAVRLALGEKLLKENQGFFILDDPFIKSDSWRLTRQVKLLKEMSSLGWQVLYFTCKDEILDNLKQEINNNEINFIELKSLILEEL